MLLKNGLVNSISGIFRRKIGDVQEIASEIAQAYNAYAQMGMGPLADPVILTGTEQMKLRTPLVNMMTNRLPGPAAAAQIAQGVTAFWLLPPVHSGGGGTCASIIVPPGMAKLIQARSDTVDKAAAALADVLHLMTKTVFFVYPAPIPPGFIL